MFGIWHVKRAEFLTDRLGDDGGVLAFYDQKVAEKRAAREFGCESYEFAERDGRCVVVTLPCNHPIGEAGIFADMRNIIEDALPLEVREVLAARMRDVLARLES